MLRLMCFPALDDAGIACRAMDRFHRIRHDGGPASSERRTDIAKVRALLGAQAPKQDDLPTAEIAPSHCQNYAPKAVVQYKSSRPTSAGKPAAKNLNKLDVRSSIIGLNVFFRYIQSMIVYPHSLTILAMDVAIFSPSS